MKAENQSAFLEGIDGGWTEWFHSPCSVSCSDDANNPGTIRRTRTCTDPMPHGGGMRCQGASEEVIQCQRRPCQGAVHESFIL